MALNIFLTGASGFIGSNLRKAWADRYAIIPFDRLRIPTGMDAYIHLAGLAHDIAGQKGEKDYQDINVTLTRNVYDAFLASTAEVFIFISSVKAVADKVDGAPLDETLTPVPSTVYGRSKWEAEKYIIDNPPWQGQRVYILRPAMVHGPGNKGNLNQLYGMARRGWPWPLARFHNSRSFCSLDNLLFVMGELVERKDIPLGIYHVCDSGTLSTTDIYRMAATASGKHPVLMPIPRWLVRATAKLGDVIPFPLDSHRLAKLTEDYPVSNAKLLAVLNKPLPLTAREGMSKTFRYFNQATQKA